MPRMGTLMIFSRSFPMIDSSAMMSAMFSRIDSRTLSRWRARSPAERSLRSALEPSKGRKTDSRVRFTGGDRTDRRRRSVLPEVVGGVLEHDVHAALAIARVEEVLHHRVVLLRLLLVTRARLGDDAADVAHRRHELLLDRFLERLVGAIGDALAAAARRPEVGDHLLTEPFGGRADDRDLLLDRLQEPLVGLQLLLGVAILHPRLVDERLGVVEVVLEERLGLLLVGVDERLGDLLLEQLQVLLVQDVLEELEVLLARVVREVTLLHHVDEGLADVDRVDAVALDVVGERVVEGLHDEARRDAAHALALGVLAQLLHVDLLGLALLDDLLAVVELELGDEVAFGIGLEAGEDREHGRDLERVRGDVRPEVREADDLLVDLDLLGQPEVVGHLHDHDAVEDRLVGVVGLELLPLRLVGVGEDHGVDVDETVAARRRDHLLLRGGDHGVQVLGLVLEDLDELAHAAVADVDRAVEIEHARVALRVHVELRDVLAADQHRGVLVVRVDGRDDADADAVALREEARVDRHLLVPAAVLLLQAEAAHRAEVALDVHAEHLLELLPQMARNEVEGLLGHGAVLDRVEGLGGLEAPLEALDQRALPRADRAHQVEDLAALLALERGRVEVAHDLRHRLLDPEELVAEEVVDLERLVLVEPLDARVVGLLDVQGPAPHDVVEDAGVRELGKAGIFADEVEVLEEGAAPDLRLAGGAVLFDQLLEGGPIHWQLLWLDVPRPGARRRHGRWKSRILLCHSDDHALRRRKHCAEAADLSAAGHGGVDDVSDVLRLGYGNLP